MKLKNFRIQNFKSIDDSGISYLANPDNITILAGQNESGKSSILQALYAFETGKVNSEDLQSEKMPLVECSFFIEETNIVSIIEEEFVLGIELGEYFGNLKEIIVNRKFTSESKSEILIESVLGDEFLRLVRKHNERVSHEAKVFSKYKDILKEIAKAEAGLKLLTENADSPSVSKQSNSQLDKLKLDRDELLKDKTLNKLISFSKLVEEKQDLVKSLKAQKASEDSELKALRLKLEKETFEDDEDEVYVESLIAQKISEIGLLESDIVVHEEQFAEELRSLQKKFKIVEAYSEKDVQAMIKAIPNLIFNWLPLFIFFDDFCDLLPDKILISDLVNKKEAVQGYQAVKNMETILSADFAALDKHHDSKREMHQDDYKETITANFNERWKQKISDGNGATIHVKYSQGRTPNSAYLSFYINTKKNEYLHPAQRSQGFKWFLSFFLHLKAEDQKRNSLVILFDEPGLYLHSKAQNDMLLVFEELAEKSQIIYSTHSPYLIDSKKLHRVRLVINSKEHGTTIEKITTSKLKNQPNAIKPIADAIGLDVAGNFSVVTKKNVLLEGLSDFHYFTALKTILAPKDDFAFVPSMGSSNVHLLMQLCIGWGLEWLIIFDKAGVEEDYKKIVRHFFDNKESDAQQKIKILSSEGIEDMFAEEDIRLIVPEYIMKGSNSTSVKSFGGKELLARLFLDKVISGTITKEKLSTQAISNFSEVFKFIKKGFSK